MNSHDTTHGPPDGLRTFDDDEARLPLEKGTLREVAHLAAERALVVASARYRLLNAALRARSEGVEAMDLVRLMALGQYRLLRDDAGLLVIDDDGKPQRDYMSFRHISTELERLTGEDISHETLRRWWARVWPGEPVPELSFRQATQQAALRLKRRHAANQPDGGVPEVVFIPPTT